MIAVLKIGGSVITDKTCAETPRLEVMERIAGELSAWEGGLVLVHGAGSYGHPQVKDNGGMAVIVRGDETAREAALRHARFIDIVHSSVAKLNALFVDILCQAGVPAVGFHPLEIALQERGRLISLDTGVVSLALERGFVPVLHGDVVFDRAIGVSVLSGDQLTPFLARQLGVDLVGVGTNVDGILDPQGKVVPEVNPSNFQEIKKWLGGGSGIDVTGGMAGKVEELLSQGVRARVFNASRKGVISSFLRGEKVGTLITGGVG